MAKIYGGNSIHGIVREYKEADATNPINNKTPADIDAWIDANVTDLASAKAALKKVGRVLVIHEKQLEAIEALLKRLL